MNRFLCEPNGFTLNISTAYQFTQKLNEISLYVFPTLALAGNSLTLLVFLTNPQLNRSSFSVYVKSMAISDTLVLLFKLASYLNKTSRYFYFSLMCTILIFCGEASTLLSIWIIALITIERTLVVLFPLHTKSFVSAYRARVLVLSITIIVLIFSARILIIPIDVSPEQKKRCHPISTWHSYRNLNATITEFGYCYIPLTIVIIGNFITLYTVKRALFRRRDMVTNNSDQQKRQMDSNDHQLMLMLLVVTLTFIVCFVPFTITNVIARWGLPFRLCFTQKSFETYLILRSCSDLLKDFNFCINFIIYCVSGRRFRSALCSLFTHDHRKSLTASRNYQISQQGNDRLLRKNLEQKSRRSSTRHTIDESQL
jgi:hypothetical protein